MISRRAKKSHPPSPRWPPVSLKGSAEVGLAAPAGESRGLPSTVVFRLKNTSSDFSRDLDKRCRVQRRASDAHSHRDIGDKTHDSIYPLIPTDDLGVFMKTLVEGMRSDGAQLVSTAKDAVASTFDVSHVEYLIVAYLGYGGSSEACEDIKLGLYTSEIRRVDQFQLTDWV